jgi:FkbM family methyltransferase
VREADKIVTPDEKIPFQHYSARQRMTAWISQTLFDHVTYTVRQGLLKGMKRRGGLGWVPAFVKTRPSPEETFWQGLSLEGQVVYDVGAFHGLLTLFFARRARQVISYEPNSRNHTRLQENLRLNGIQNVTVRKLGLSSHESACTMTWNPLTPGGSTIDTGLTRQLARSDVSSASEAIQLTTLDQEIFDGGLPAPDFVKIDVEGLELEALRGARRVLAAYGPALFLEMHGETMGQKKRKAAEIVEYLQASGYRNIHHVESDAVVSATNTELAAQGHLYCTRANQ